MNSKVDPAFWRRFNALPLQIQQLARNAFLKGYRETAIGLQLFESVARFEENARLLRLLETEKACKELHDELSNRPDWVGVPLAALTRLLDLPQSTR